MANAKEIRKTANERRLWAFCANHYEKISCKEIAEILGVSKTRAWSIVKAGERLNHHRWLKLYLDKYPKPIEQDHPELTKQPF